MWSCFSVHTSHEEASSYRLLSLQSSHSILTLQCSSQCAAERRCRWDLLLSPQIQSHHHSLHWNLKHNILISLIHQNKTNFCHFTHQEINHFKVEVCHFCNISIIINNDRFQTQSTALHHRQQSCYQWIIFRESELFRVWEEYMSSWYYHHQLDRKWTAAAHYQLSWLFLQIIKD